jgi:flagellar hook-basal body complex protein FliE
MDPLSSLQFAVSPELRAGRLSKLTDGMANKAIPAPELEKLNASRGPEPAPTMPVTGSGSFENTLGKIVSEVSGKQTTANQAVEGLMTGGNVSLHQAMIAMEEASVSFQLMVEVRNKLLDSYQELMRMQV